MRAQTNIQWTDGAWFNSNWSDSGNWSGGLPNLSSEVAYFTGSKGGSVTVNRNQSTGGILFDSSLNTDTKFTNNNTLTISNGNYGIINNSSQTNTFQNKMALGANMTWSSTNSSGGGLVFTNTVNNAGKNLTLLTTNSNNTIDISGIISGSGALTKTGAGAVNLSGANTYTGATSVNAGTLVISNQTASPTMDIATGAVLEFNVASGTLDNTANTKFTGTGTLNKTGSGIMQWGTSSAEFALESGALIDIQGGVFRGGHSGNEIWTSNLSDLNVATGAIFRSVEANVRVDVLTGSGRIETGWSGAGYSEFTIGVDNGTGDFAGVIADFDAPGQLVKTGTGTQTLSGANTYTGTTTVNAGTLSISADNNLGAAPTTPTAGKLVLDGGTLQTTATLTLDSNRGIALGAGGGTLNVVTFGADTTYNGIIAGSGDLNKTGAGVAYLGGANTFTGDLTLTSGALVANHSSALGAGGTTTVNSGATLGVNGGINITSETNINLAGMGVNGIYGALLNLSGNNEVGSALTLTADAGLVSSSGKLTVSGGITGSGKNLQFNANAPDEILVNSVIGTGTGRVTKIGTGTLTFSGANANTFTGGLNINDGTVNLNKTAGVNALGASSTLIVGDNIGAANSATLALQASNQMPDSTALVLNSDGRISMGTATDAISTVAGTGQIDLGTGKLIIGNDNSSSTFGGSITGDGTLEKNGSGTLTLTSNISYDGTLQLGGGTLKLSDIDLSVGNLVITADTVLDFSGVSTLTAGTFSFLSDDITLNIINWEKNVDYFYSSNWAGVAQDIFNNNGSKPASQVIFDGWTGNNTGWDSYDDQIYPNVPEPSTYGFLFLAACSALFGVKRFRDNRKRKLANAS